MSSLLIAAFTYFTRFFFEIYLCKTNQLAFRPCLDPGKCLRTLGKAGCGGHTEHFFSFFFVCERPGTLEILSIRWTMATLVCRHGQYLDQYNGTSWHLEGFTLWHICPVKTDANPCVYVRVCACVCLCACACVWEGACVCVCVNVAYPWVAVELDLLALQLPHADV